MHPMRSSGYPLIGKRSAFQADNMGSSPITRIILFKIMNKKENNNNFISLINKPNKHYKNFIQFAIKKGKKETMEKILRDSLFAVAKNNKKQFWTNIEKAVENTTMLLNIKVKRKGSKNIYIPIKMKPGYSKFLSYNWILKSAKNRHEKKLSNKFVNEIIDTAENKSNSIKKKIEIYKLIEDNMHNVSKR